MKSKNDKFKIDFTGIGVAKAATTWVYNCLREHPEICMSSPKETNFFQKNIHYEKGEDFYKSYFSHCNEQKIKGEFSVGYLPKAKRVVPRLKEHNQQLKIIACLRDPVGRACSQYKSSLKKGGRAEVYNGFTEALQRWNALVDKGFYYAHLKNYYDEFPKSNILVLLFKDTKEQPKQVLEKMYNFLGVDKTLKPSVAEEKVNVTNRYSVKKITVPFINKFAYRVSENLKGGIVFDLVKKMNVNYYVKQLLKLNRKSVKGRGLDEFSITPELKLKLQKMYLDDIEKLEQLVERDLSHWKP